MQTFVRSGGSAYLKLVEEQLHGRVVLMFEDAIGKSFERDHGPQTEAEIKRRFELCCSIFEVLRVDLHWGLERIEDHLSTYLRCELDGKNWEPDKRTLWVPKDGE